MPDNRVSATLSAEDQQAVLAAINTIKQKLPFLVNLTADQRQSLPKMGDQSVAFVNKALEVATQNPDLLPRNFVIDEMSKDVALFNALQPIVVALTQLVEFVNDTATEVGSEAYTAGLAVYLYAQAAGKDAPLQAALDDLGQRFARKSKGKTPPPQA